MSKIYEALLKAEMERASATGRPVQNSSLALQDLLHSLEDFPESTSRDDRERPLSTAQAPTSEPPAYLPPDLSEVARHSWTPMVASLPVLEERGAGVEQFRNLRSHVTEFRDQRPLKSVLVSSGLPGEGKSFVAINLALAFSRHKGNRVLLIDGDMRRGSLHKLLGAPREPGLAEFLSGQASMTEVMQRPLLTGASQLPPGLASLTFIAAGHDADKAGDLAANSRFPELLARAGLAFDWIILDSSPVALVSDGVSLAHACDGVLLVCREGVTKYKTAQQAQAQLKSANVLGFVLNAAHNLPKGDYYSSYDTYRVET